MQWSDVRRAPSELMLRQFAGLLVLVFGSLAAWRIWGGQVDVWTWILGAVGLGVGGLGLIWPAAVRAVFMTWMIVAFPIGWTVSRLMLAILFYLVFAPMAVVFRMVGRDALWRRKPETASYWTRKPGGVDARQYFRQF